MEIVFDKLCKNYRTVNALKDFSLTWTEGIHALLGPNGAGKTTLMNLIAGLIKASSGSIMIGGTPIENCDSLKGKIGYLPQKVGLYGFFTAKEIMEYFAYIKGASITAEEIKDRLKQVNLENEINTKYKNLSGGMKQRLAIAVTLLNNPAIVLLDEPTVGLDPMERHRVKDIIKKIGNDRIIILSTHIISDVEELANDIVFLKEGKIASFKKAEEIGDHIEDVYLSIFGAE